MSGFPRINCLVPECRRGTTRLEPYEDGVLPEWICGPHWRTVPQAWRKRLSLYRRRYSAAEARDDTMQMRTANRCFWGRWRAIKRLFEDTEQTGEMPIVMHEALRRDRLL